MYELITLGPTLVASDGPVVGQDIAHAAFSQTAYSGIQAQEANLGPHKSGGAPEGAAALAGRSCAQFKAARDRSAT
jgi:hypothetical protein